MEVADNADWPKVIQILMKVPDDSATTALNFQCKEQDNDKNLTLSSRLVGAYAVPSSYPHFGPASQCHIYMCRIAFLLLKEFLYRGWLMGAINQMILRLACPARYVFSQEGNHPKFCIGTVRRAEAEIYDSNIAC